VTTPHCDDMGIQRLSQWLSSTFPDAFSKETGLEADHVYLDMNEILHKVLQSLGRGADLESFVEALTARLDNIFQLVTPTQSVFLAVDGAAPAAKIATQRCRRRDRVKSAAASAPSNGKQRRAAARDEASRGVITKNMLTPGVPFMAKITTALVQYCTSTFGLAGTLSGRRHKELPGGIRATVSGADCGGEGEHKILSAILRNSAGGKGVHAVIGSDSDLLIMPLGQRSISSQVRVVRFLPKKVLSVLNVGALGRHLKDQMKQISATAAVASRPAKNTALLSPSEQELGLRRDFVFIALLRGDDYLPPLDCDRDPANLWACYLRWRPKHPDAGLVGKAREGADANASNSGEHLALRRAQLISFMTCCAGASAISPVTVEDDTTAKVASYLGGLLWCLETYASNCCPDVAFKFPGSLVGGACARTIAEHVPVLCEDKLETCRRASLPLGPLTAAVATLPVSEVRNLILPTAPCLSPLFETGGLLFQVGRMEEGLVSLQALVDAVAPGSKKGIKRRKALDAHRRQHSDIDAVSLPALDAEVQRLCENAPSIEAKRLAPLVRSKLEPDGVAGLLPPEATVPSSELHSEGAEEEEEEEESDGDENEEDDNEDTDDSDGEVHGHTAKRARLGSTPLQACPSTGHLVSTGQRARLGGLALLLNGAT